MAFQRCALLWNLWNARNKVMRDHAILSVDEVIRGVSVAVHDGSPLVVFLNTMWMHRLIMLIVFHSMELFYVTEMDMFLRFIGFHSGYFITFCSRSKGVEVKALRETLVWLVSLSLTQVIVEIDSQLVMKAVLSTVVDYSKANTLIAECEPQLQQGFNLSIQ